MKLFVTLALLAIGSAHAVSWSDCDGCKQGMATLMMAGSTDEQVHAQTDLLINGVCLTAEDPAGCTKGVRKWWPGMNEALTHDKGVPEYFCTELGMCNAPKTYYR